jgi:hypothetical protein
MDLGVYVRSRVAAFALVGPTIQGWAATSFALVSTTLAREESPLRNERKSPPKRRIVRRKFLAASLESALLCAGAQPWSRSSIRHARHTAGLRVSHGSARVGISSTVAAIHPRQAGRANERSPVSVRVGTRQPFSYRDLTAGVRTAANLWRSAKSLQPPRFTFTKSVT